MLEVRVGPHGGNLHLHGPVKGVLVEAGCLMGSTADDHRVNVGATSATAAVRTTLGKRGMLARKVRRRAAREGRVAGHCMRRIVWVRVTTRGGYVVRPCVWEEGSAGWRGIAEIGVWWRWWEGVHGVNVARGFARRITTALNDMGVGSTSCSTSRNNVGRLRVETSVYERHLIKNKCERIMGWGERARLRAGVRGISKRERWKVGGTIFGAIAADEGKTERHATVKTTSRTSA